MGADKKQRQWLDLDIIALVSKHVSGALVVMLGFWVLEVAAGRLISDESVLAAIHFTERVIIGACITRAALIMLWKLGTSTVDIISPGNGNGGHSSSILVA